MTNIFKSALLGIAIMFSVNFSFGQEISYSAVGPEQDFVRIELIGATGPASGTAFVQFFNPIPGVSMSMTKPVQLDNEGCWTGDFLGNVLKEDNNGYLVYSTVYLRVTLGSGASLRHVEYYGPQQGLHTFYGSGFKPGGGGNIQPPTLPY